MSLDYNWINLLILFGSIQGLIFSFILLVNKTHPGARYLSAFMFVLAFNGIETFSWSSGLDNYILFFDFFGYVTIYGIGPSLYLYVYTLIFPEKGKSFKVVLTHYSPVLFQLSVCLLIAGMYFMYANGLYFNRDLFMGIYNTYNFYSEPLSVISFLIYLIVSIRLFIRTNDKHTIHYVSKEGQKIVYKWIKTLLIFLIILGVSWPLTVVAPLIFDLPFNVHYYPIELVLVLFIYWIAFAGYHRMKLIYIKDIDSKELPHEADNLLNQLKKVMEVDKVFLDPTLNRDKMAAHTGINAKTISQILNQYGGKSFNDFVNHYRVNQVCDNLLSSENKHLTISGIALASGFNSQATFQRAFKSMKGMSPKEYLTLETKKLV